MTDEVGATGAGQPQRTDIRSLAVNALHTVRGALLGVVAIGFTMRDEIADYALAGAALLFALTALAAGVAWLRWTRLTYTVGAEDIRVESGLLARAARAVPYDRIQDVSLEQPLLARLLGLVDVRFETGAGGGDDLRLAFLSEHDGAALRDLVRARQTEVAEAVPEQPGDDEQSAPSAEESELLFALTPRRLVTFGLFEFSLAAVAALGGAAQQFDVLLPFDLWDLDEWQVRLAGPGAWLAGLGLWAQALGAVLAVAGLVLVGFATGLVRTTLRDWGFKLERTTRGLRRRRGLLTRTDVIVPLHRVQALLVETGIVRRRFGWHRLRIVSLAGDKGGANHDAAPFATLGEIATIATTTGFALPDETLAWRAAARTYRGDLVLLATLIAMPIAAGLVLIGDAPLAAVPLVALAGFAPHQFLRWKADRHALDARQFLARQGWFAPRLTIASRARTQSVQIVQSPLGRWRGYATLHVGIAGGTFALPGIPLAEARRWRNAILASAGEQDFSAMISPVDQAPVDQASSSLHSG